jgi:tetratricopeptide (TPR) repeat protein
MYRSRWFGKMVLTVAVLGIAFWVTTQKLSNLPPLEFWALVVGCLLALHGLGLWLTRLADEEARLAPRGLSRLPRHTILGVKAGDWFFSGGRPRLVDLFARNDAPREFVTGLLSSLPSGAAEPCLHLLVGPPGSGRSTLLLRTGQSLAEKGHPVLRVLAGPVRNTLDLILREGGSRRTVYVLVDDIDLLPQAADLVYGVMRSAKRAVIIGTAREPEFTDDDQDLLAPLEPATMLTRGVRHHVGITPQDVSALAAKLRALGRPSRSELAGEAPTSYLTAERLLLGTDPTDVWDRGAAREIPEAPKLMLALAGAAEVAIPLKLFAHLTKPTRLQTWQKSGLIGVEHGLVLPPHHCVCLAFLRRYSHDQARVQEALAVLVKGALDLAAGLTARLLWGLSGTPELRALAVEEVHVHLARLTRRDQPAELKRLWRNVWKHLDLTPEADWAEESDAAAQSLLAQNLVRRREFEVAQEVYASQVSDPVYGDIARFNLALVLARQERLYEAEAQLAELRAPVMGVPYLRGVIAEQRGDLVAALDWYEESRKLDELILPSIRRLASTYLRSGAPRAAIPLFESLLAHMPKRADVYGGLAVAHLHSGTSQRAAAQSARAIQAGVDPSVARRAVARAFRDANAYERTAGELEAVVSYDADDCEAWDELASACRWLGRFQREEQCLNQVRRCVGEDPPDLLLRLARCRRDQGQAEAALESLLLLTGSPTPPIAALVLAAEVAAACGQPETQRVMAQEAINRGDDSGWAYFWLAESLPANAPQARDAYRRAVQLLETLLAAGVPPRHGATMWQAISVAGLKLDDESLASRALHHARQEATVCKAIGTEIESVTARRSVPPDVFLDECPDAPSAGRPAAPAGVVRPPTAVPEPIRPVFLPGRAQSRGSLRV